MIEILLIMYLLIVNAKIVSDTGCGRYIENEKLKTQRKDVKIVH